MMINILSTIGMPAALEQLAEESAELAQAALKLARYLRAENPTQKSRKQGEEDLKEEVTDVILAMEALGLQADPKIRDQKRQRWIGRLSGWQKTQEQIRKAAEPKPEPQEKKEPTERTQ